MQDGDDGVPTAARERFISGFGRVAAEIEAGRLELANEAFIETVFERPPGSFGLEIMFVRQVVLDNPRSGPVRLSPEADGDTTIDCELLGQTQVPPLVVHGELTNAWWQYLAQRAAKCIPGAEEAVITGVNHAEPIRKPAELFALIYEFVKRHEGKADE